MFYGAGVPDDRHDFDPTRNIHRNNRRTVERGGSRKGSPLEGESGITSAGKTSPTHFPKEGSGGGRARVGQGRDDENTHREVDRAMKTEN